MVAPRRKLTGEVPIAGQDDSQEQFAVIQSEVPTARYEYAVLVTSTEHGILTLSLSSVSPCDSAK